MANDKTAICNIALLNLGQNMISDIGDDKDANARKCNVIFEQVVEELLADDWFFNRVRIELSQLSSTPAFGTWDYQYQIPADAIHIRGIADESWDEIRYSFVREGQYILTNETEAYLHYNQLLQDDSGVSNISKMPLWFHRLIAARMQYILAPNITKGDFKNQKAAQDYNDAYLTAKEKNGSEAFYEDEAGNTDWADGARRELP